MKLRIFTRFIIPILAIAVLFPGIIYGELKSLNDHEMSKVDAKAGGLFDTRINEDRNTEDKKTEFLDEFKDIDDMNTPSACSMMQSCAPEQNDFFYPGNQYPIRYTAPIPHCNSGGCR